MAIIDRFPLPPETIWKKYSIKTTYYQNKYNRLEQITYYWDKCEITQAWQETRSDKSLTLNDFPEGGTFYSGYTLITNITDIHAGYFHFQNGVRLTETDPVRLATAMIQRNLLYRVSGYNQGNYSEVWANMIEYWHGMKVNGQNVSGTITYISSVKKNQKGNRIGEVSGSTSNLYPQDGEKDSFWYKFNRQSITYIRGSSYYGQVLSASSSAYPNNSYSGSYWYVYSGTVQSSGSYIGEVSSDDENAFPANGAKNGYWYIKVE